MVIPRSLLFWSCSRGAEAVSHGQACLADHGDFAVALRDGWSTFLLCGSSKSREACSGCAGRAVHTGTRPGLTPTIRAEKGWRGRRELAPRRSATQLGASRGRIWTDTYVKHTVRTTTTTFSQEHCRVHCTGKAPEDGRHVGG